MPVAPAAITLQESQEALLKPLRDYQAEGYQRGVEALNKLAWAQRRRSICLVMPTGAGKSRLGVEFCKRPGRTLWLAPGSDLVRQTQDVVACLGPAAPKVSTIQLLSRMLRDGRPLPPCDRLVLDEARWSTAPEWIAPVAHYQRQGCELIALDATPATAAGQGLGHICEELIDVVSVRALIDAGFLVPFKVFAPAKEQGALAGTPAQVQTDYISAGHLRADERAIWFCETKNHAKETAADFTARGLPAAVICDDTPEKERRWLLGSEGRPGALARGEVLVAVCAQLLRQGIDVPPVSVIGLARRVGSLPLWRQAIGRGARPWPAGGKTHCTVFDLYGGCVPRFGLPDEPIQWSLTGAAARRLEALPPCAHCPHCLAWYPGGSVCPACGTARPPPMAPRVKAAVLVELSRANEPPEVAQERLERHVREAYFRARAQSKTGFDADKSAWQGAYSATHGKPPGRPVVLAAIQRAHEAWDLAVRLANAQQSLPLQ